MYGQDQAKSWFGTTDTKIITRINASEAAEDISRLIGDQEIERRIKSATRTEGRTSITEGIQREIRRVVTASELASRLGPTERGVRVLFIGLGEAIYELELPYIGLRRLQEPIIPADWTQASPEETSNRADGSVDAESPSSISRLSKDLADQILKTRD